MATQLLMPKATAVWLVENTALTFEQIATFCDLHLLEVQAIADGEANHTYRGLNPVDSSQLTREEIAKAEKDPDYHLQTKATTDLPNLPKKKVRGYTPLSRRQDRPNAILWLVRHYPELKNAQIARLVGTTKATIEQVRNRTHWNMANLVAHDPVTLGLCSQTSLDAEVASLAPRPHKNSEDETLLDATITENFSSSSSASQDMLDTDAIFSKLVQLKNTRSDQ